MKHFPFGKYEENGRQTTVGAIPFGRPKQARRINLTATRQTSNSSVGSIHESPARTLRTNGTATCRNVRPNKPSPAGEGGPPNALRMAVDEVLRSIRTARTAGDKPPPYDGKTPPPRMQVPPVPPPTVRLRRIISRFSLGKQITFPQEIYHVLHAHISRPVRQKNQKYHCTVGVFAGNIRLISEKRVSVGERPTDAFAEITYPNKGDLTL